MLIDPSNNAANREHEDSCKTQKTQACDRLRLRQLNEIQDVAAEANYNKAQHYNNNNRFHSSSP